MLNDFFKISWLVFLMIMGNIGECLFMLGVELGVLWFFLDFIVILYGSYYYDLYFIDVRDVG